MKNENMEEILEEIRKADQKTFEIATKRKGLIPSMEMELLTPDSPHTIIQTLLKTYKLPVDVFNESDTQSRYYNLIIRGRDELAERFYDACQAVFSAYSNASRSSRSLGQSCRAFNRYDRAVDRLFAVCAEMGRPQKKEKHPYQSGIM